MNAIASAIEAAKAAAANLPAEVAQQSNTAVVQAPARGAALTLDNMMIGSMSVDGWLKVNQYGLFVGNDNTPFAALELGLDMSEIGYNYAIKFGNPAQYLKTYDQVSCISGGTWAQAMARAQQIDPKAREYRSGDLPFIVLNDIKKPDGSVIMAAGKRLGHGLSTTGWTAFADLVKKLRADGVDPNSAKILVTLGSTPMKNAKGTWGVLNFIKYEVDNPDA